jgi:AbiU2
MGTDLEILFGEPESEVDWLQHKWDEFQELFGRGAAQLEVLNTAGPNFFYMLQKLLYEDAMLHLCRLTDPPESRVKGTSAQNLMIAKLADLISNPTLKAAVVSAAKHAQDTCDFARKWRDKRLAHSDLLIHRQGWASSLPEVTIGHIDNAIDSLSTTLYLVRGYYGHPPVAQIG